MLYDHMKSIGFNENQSKIIADAFNKELILEEGEYFIKEHDVCSRIGFLVSGICRHFYNTSDEQITRWVVLPGNFITSLSSFIKQSPSNENINALKKTVLLTISKSDWELLYKENEFVRNIWLNNIEQNYLGMEERVFNLIAKSAEDRYKWLLERYPEMNLQIPDKYLASILGIHPRHLSRVRKKSK